MHALGPGLLIYEIQQASDTTYRAYDWGRPQSPGRHLNIEESVAVARPVGPADRVHAEVTAETGSARAIDCALFSVDLVRVSDSLPWTSNTNGLAFQVITAIDGSAELSCGDERVELGKFETAVVTGAAGAYQVRAIDGQVVLLRSTVPD
jgi:mannose-6-phosphate isomerase